MKIDIETGEEEIEVSFKLKDLVKEHERLISILEGTDRLKQRAEAIRQRKELQSYKKAKSEKEDEND